MRRLIQIIVVLVAMQGLASATTVKTSAHVEPIEVSDNVVVAQGTSTVEITNVDSQHVNETLRIIGRLYEEANCNTASNCCNSQVDFCNSSQIISAQGQSLSCSTSRTGTCSTYWDITADGKVDLNPTPPQLTSRSTVTCQQAECNPSCEECI